MKRISALIALLILTNIPISCDFGCGPFTPLESRIIDLSASVGLLNSEFDFSLVESTDFVEAAIEVTIADMDFSEVAAHVDMIHFSFLNSAYACSPADPMPTQAIESIEITSDESIFAKNREYEPGESLNDLFKVTKYSFEYDEISIADYIKLQQDYLDYFANFGDYIIFQLGEKPDSTINQKILMNFVFSDLEQITVETGIFEVAN